MEIKKPILILLIIFIISILTVYILEESKYKKLNKRYQQVIAELTYYKIIDTTAIHKIDSIEYNIKQKDSIIYNIKTEFINEIEIIKANNDIDAVAQFKELVESD